MYPAAALTPITVPFAFPVKNPAVVPSNGPEPKLNKPMFGEAMGAALTCSFETGAVVPMPMLPVFATRIYSVLFARRLKLFADISVRSPLNVCSDDPTCIFPATRRSPVPMCKVVCGDNVPIPTLPSLRTIIRGVCAESAR